MEKFIVLFLLIHFVKSIDNIQLGYVAQDLLTEDDPIAHTMASGYLWEIWSDSYTSNPQRQPSPSLSANFAAALGHCSRLMCSDNFTVSNCLTSEVDHTNSYHAQNFNKNVENNVINGEYNHLFNDEFKRLFEHSALVSIPEHYELSKMTVFHEEIMTISYSRSQLSKKPKINNDNNNDDNCWVYPGEHMSFSLVHEMFNRNKQSPPIEDTHVVKFETPVGSLLHLLGTENWFHLLREGVGGMLFLNLVLPVNTPILVPDTKGYRRVFSLFPESYFDQHPIIFIPLQQHHQSLLIGGKEVKRIISPKIYIPDWRPFSNSAHTSFIPGNFGSVLFNIDHIAHQSASVFKAIRMMLFKTHKLLKTQEKVKIKTPMKVIYISRSDASIRQVPEEGKLVRAMKHAINQLAATSSSKHRIRKCQIKTVLLNGLPLEETIKLFYEADMVIGPHGAGLMNAPLFSREGTVVVAFGLQEEHESKEENLQAICKATGMSLIRLPSFRSSFMGNYELVNGQTYDDVAQSLTSHLLFGF